MNTHSDWGVPLTRLLAIAPAVLFLALVSACAGLSQITNPPKVSLANLRLAEVGLMEQRYLATLRIQNPNETQLDVRGMEFTIYVNERKFADGIRGERFSVPGYGEALVAVNVTSSLLRVLEQFRDLNERESAIFNYRISGSIKIVGLPGTLPFNYEDELDLSAGSGG